MAEVRMVTPEQTEEFRYACRQLLTKAAAHAGALSMRPVRLQPPQAIAEYVPLDGHAMVRSGWVQTGQFYACDFYVDNPEFKGFTYSVEGCGLLTREAYFDAKPLDVPIEIKQAGVDFVDISNPTSEEITRALSYITNVTVKCMDEWQSGVQESRLFAEQNGLDMVHSEEAEELIASLKAVV